MAIFDRYNLHNLRKCIAQPQKFTQEVTRIITRVTTEVFKLKYGNGVDVMSKDWDNLIILDACRYDIFEQVNDIEGKLECVVSRGSQSVEFLENNIEGKELHDTIYITGNPKCSVMGVRNEFYDITYAFDRDTHAKSGWSHLNIAEEQSPMSVYDSAISDVDRYPNKRKIIHFMQPHAPYHGPQAKQLRKRLSRDHGLRFSHLTEHKDLVDIDSDKIYNSLLHTLPDGYITSDELTQIYIENLQIVLDYVEKLVQTLDGKTVITADHGELLGETQESKIKNTIYPAMVGHPYGEYVPELRLVPWLVIASDERPTIMSDSPIEKTKVEQETVDKQLRMLGYKN